MRIGSGTGGALPAGRDRPGAGGARPDRERDQSAGSATRAQGRAQDRPPPHQGQWGRRPEASKARAAGRAAPPPPEDPRPGQKTHPDGTTQEQRPDARERGKNKKLILCDFGRRPKPHKMEPLFCSFLALSRTATKTARNTKTRRKQPREKTTNCRNYRQAQHNRATAGTARGANAGS